MSVRYTAELEEVLPETVPQLSVVPESPVLVPFERGSLTESAITRCIAQIVKEARKIPKKIEAKPADAKDAKADGDKAAKPETVDHDAQRRMKRQEVAVSVFQKFHMLDKTAVTDFTDMYSKAEQGAIDPDTDTRRELVGKVSMFIEHPVIQAAMAVAKEPGLYAGKDDGVIVQRTAALLLEGVEPADAWADLS